MELDGAAAWVPVKKNPKAEEVLGDIDPSIWVLFLKKMGSESFSVRFPEDPTVLAEGENRIFRASRGGEVFEVMIGPPNSDLQVDVQSALERIVQTETHTYRIRAKTLDFESSNAAQFLSSFSVFS